VYCLTYFLHFSFVIIYFLSIAPSVGVFNYNYNCGDIGVFRPPSGWRRGRGRKISIGPEYIASLRSEWLGRAWASPTPVSWTVDFSYLGRAWASPTLSWSTRIDRPTDRPTVSVPFTWYWYVARAHAATPPCHTHVNSAVRSGDSFKTENADDGKAKSRDARATARLERETSEPLLPCRCRHTCILGFHVRQFFSPVTSHKPFFTVSYISTTRTHRILDTYAQIIHTGVHRPHPLA